MLEYKNLISQVLCKGKESPDSTGVGILEILGASAEFNLQKKFPVVTCRQLPYNQAFGELSAFLKGAMTVEEFQEEGCNFWNLFSDKEGYLGPVCGSQWRVNHIWPIKNIDQLESLVTNLKDNPNSKHHILSSWHVNLLNSLALPSCYISTQFFVREGELHQIVTQRSCDLMLGFPSDIIVHALLQYILAQQCGFKAGKLQFNFGSLHIYKPHIMQAIKLEKLPIYENHKFFLDPDATIDNFKAQDAQIENYVSGPVLKFELFKKLCK